ncbi:MAG: type II toxin-antitoxin system HipA family toxin [Dysgonamonadaceae bacterium]|jgi:serine/threonine-protein kinase HipA|nr:type II toxin-antitoxin system HipA family toxin [Dysgonamonadaceae bacterium]
MDTVLKVKLWGKDVAVVSWNDDRGYATIEFYNSFAKEGWDIAPLTMPIDDILRNNRIFSFPIHRGKTFKGLPGLLADSLPDNYGNSVIDEWFASKQMAVSVTPLDRLSYIGKRGMGALEYEPVIDIAGLNDSSRIEIEQLTELAKQILNNRENFSAHLQKGDQTILDILRVGTSAGGAKPKAIIAFNETTNEVRSGQVKAPNGFSYWLLKFDGVEDNKLKDNPLGIGRIEYAYHKMAIASGIRMTECRLLHEGDYAHFMTKRFDRTVTGEKLHTQTLCAMAHFDRDERYSYEQIFQVMRRLYMPYSDMEQMFRRMVFNVIARNQDDHTKNHAFIMNKLGKWELAPAYDLCYAYSPSGRWTNLHQLSLNNKRDNFTLEDLLTVAKKMDIKNSREIVQQIIGTVSQWENYALDAGVRDDHILQIKQMLRKIL